MENKFDGYRNNGLKNEVNTKEKSGTKEKTYIPVNIIRNGIYITFYALFQLYTATCPMGLGLNSLPNI